MARKKKNKNLQTFNVYPFLADYGINVPLQKKQEGGNNKVPPALSADYNFLNFGDCKGGGCAGDPYKDALFQGFVGAEGNELDDAMLQLGAKGLIGTFNRSGLGLHGYGEAGVQTPLNQAFSGDINPQPFYKAGVKTGYTGAPIMIGDANYSGLGIEGFGEYDSNTGVNVGGNLSYGPLNLRGGYNFDTKSPFFGGGINVNFARGGQLRKAQGGVETSVEIDENVTPRIELTGNLGETEFDFSTCYREKGALICNGQVVIGAEGDPNLTTSKTIIPGEEIVSENLDPHASADDVLITTQLPDEVIKSKDFSFTNPVTNLGLRTNLGYQAPSGIYGNIQGEGGFRTSDFTNFNPYLKGDLSLGYAGDNWNAELLGRYDSNEGFSGGVEGSYGPGFINALYNPETNSPQFTAGLRIPFAKGGQLRKYEEAGQTQEDLTGFEYQRKLNELRDKQVNASLGAGPAFANSNLFNLMNVFTGVKNFATDAQMGFPNAINPATGQEYSDFSFKDITIKNPTGENRILNTKVLEDYMSSNKSDRKKIDQDELWLKPNEVQADVFNQLMDYRQETYPGMFSNSSMDLDGNINYDQVTIPNPNYDEVLWEQTGDPQYGPTIVEDFDVEKHGTEFDRAEANLGDYNAESFVSDEEGNFDESNIVFTTYKDGALTEETYDPEKDYSDHTYTENVQDNINDQFDTESQRFGGTLRFQDAGQNNEEQVIDENRVSTIDDARNLVLGYNDLDLESNQIFDPSILPVNTQSLTSKSSGIIDTQNVGSTNQPTTFDSKTSFEDAYNIYSGEGSDQFTVNRSKIGNLIFGDIGGKGNQVGIDLTKPRHVKQLTQRANEAGFDNIEEYLNTLGYRVENDQVISVPSIAKQHSYNISASNTGTGTDDMVSSSVRGQFDTPGPWNNWQGGFMVSGHGEGGYDDMYALANNPEAVQKYWEEFGQYTDDISGLYSNPELRGTFLPEVTLVGNRKNGGALRRFLQNGGTPVDTDFTNIDADNDGMPDYLNPDNVEQPFIGPIYPPLVDFPGGSSGEQGNPFNTGTGAPEMVDNDGDGIPDYVDIDGGDGTGNPIANQPPGPATVEGCPCQDGTMSPDCCGETETPEANPFNTGTGDDEPEVNNDLGIDVSYGDTFGQKLANRTEEFIKTSGFSNVASSFVQNIGEPTIDFLSGMKTGFDNWAKDQRALEEGDDAMEIVPTIEASRSAKGDREFRTGDVKPWTQTQEEIYGQLAQLGGQPTNPQDGPDYSMLLQYIPSQSGARFDEMYLQKQMNDGGQIVDVDLELLKELMAAGADIEIL